MASTKASRKAKRESSRKDNGSDNGSIMKTRKAHQSKDLLTKDAVKKATAKAKETRDTISNRKSLKGKQIAQNGRQPGRQLIRWNASTDQILLLIMEYELKKHGLVIPYDAIAKRLASEKDTTGACVQQHLAKLRKEMLARGCWVPPLAGKSSARHESADVRGLVMVTTRGGGQELKEVGWNEDAFKYVDVVPINQPKVGRKKFTINEQTGLAAGLAKMKRSSSSVPGGEDPADLPSEDEFDPAYHKPKQLKRTPRLAKSAGSFNKKFDELESGTDNESNSDAMENDGGPPVMMALYESEEEVVEEEEEDGKVILNLPLYIAAQFPRGVSGNARAILIGDTNTEGESVSYGDDRDSDSFAQINRTPNSSAAMMEDQDYSIMDANNFENYHAAFSGTFEPEYSIMDANTHENYMAAFGDGIGHSVHDYNTESSLQNINTSPENPYVVGYSGPAPDDDMFGPSNDSVSSSHQDTNVEHTLPLEIQQLYRNFVARTAHPTASGQNAGTSSNTGQRLFPSGTRVRDIFNGGPINSESIGNSAGNNISFNQAFSMNDPLGGNIHYGFGEDSGAAVNNNIGSIDPGGMAEEDLADLDEVSGLMDYAQYDEPDFGSDEYATFRDDDDDGPLFESEY